MNVSQPISQEAHAPAPSLALDLGRPQRAVYELMEAGAFSGAILDVGCASGEHSLLLAAHGLIVTGVDDQPTLIARARRHAQARHLDVDFALADLENLSILGRVFDCALDAGTLHRVAPAERPAYVRSLRSVLAPGARVYVLVFGDHERGHGGPSRISQRELHAAFVDGFTVEKIVDSRFESHIFPGGANAWLATLTRL
jgi:2-polyprenyl-3-methyl-5-hydroxy-6-metoxy-1,4-benzoquinol methylase